MTHGPPATKSKRNNRKPPGAGSHKIRESIIVHGGVSRVVIVKGCPVCGYKLQQNKVTCQSILIRFQCPVCGHSITNTNANRCKVCHTMCSDSETLKSHVWDGCDYAGKLYPWKGGLAFRDENPIEKVTP